MAIKEFPTLLFPQMERDEKVAKLRGEMQAIKDSFAKDFYMLSKSEINEFFE